MWRLSLASVLLAAFFGLGSGLVSADPVALQTADVSCATDTGRYVDCGNGTVTDNLTGLTWLQDANCLGIHDWYEASIEVRNLADGYCGLSDGSSPGEWRLPTKAEWETMVAAAVNLGNCDPTITNDSGNGCWTGGSGSSFINIVGFEFGNYWSATSSSSANAFVLLMINGTLITASKGAGTYVWAVRGGQ